MTRRILMSASYICEHRPPNFAAQHSRLLCQGNPNVLSSYEISKSFCSESSGFLKLKMSFECGIINLEP